MNDEENEDGWKILQPDIILFETKIGSLEKPIPHPILDDPSKMMRIIANPVYDKLTFARAVSMRKIPTSQRTLRQKSQLNRPKEKKLNVRSQSSDTTETQMMLFANSSETKENQSQSNVTSVRPGVPPFRLPTPPSDKRLKSGASRSTAYYNGKSSRSNTQALQSALAEGGSNTKKPVAPGTIRYVNSRHGFEVQRYSSTNWLAIDVYTKDACQSHEKTFREMLEKKRQHERLSRSIYSSDYYTKRWNELLKSYKQGHLTHAEWAQQNYQLFCLKTLYHQAVKREQSHIDSDIKQSRRAHANSIFKQWKEAKTEGSSLEQSNLTTSSSQKTTEQASVLSNNSYLSPLSKLIDENRTPLADRSKRMSMSTNTDSELQRILLDQSKNSFKTSSTISSSSPTSYPYDEQRWSLQAMLKRVVGLAEPLQPASSVAKNRLSPMTNASNDSGFESV